MNINCIICSDLFAPNSDIYGTKCGHIFHHICIIQWLERDGSLSAKPFNKRRTLSRRYNSYTKNRIKKMQDIISIGNFMIYLIEAKTCPQCRTKITDRNIHRIYFNIISSENIEEDAVSLQNKVDSLNLSLRLKDNFVKTTEIEIAKVNEEKKLLEDKLKSKQVDYEKYKSGNASLKEQVKMYQEQIKVMDQIQTENKQLKDKLRAFNIETTALKGTYEEAQLLINNCDSLLTLSMISNSLKKELISMEQKRNHVLSKLRRKESELHETKKECAEFKAKIDTLKYELKAHKQCEVEMKQLREEISKLMENNGAINPGLMRVVTESPAPRLTKLKENEISFETVDSPSVSKRVQEIKDSNSPYLTVQSNCLATFLKTEDISMKFKDSLSNSIFKKFVSTSTTTTTLRKAVPEGSYNGLGGHAKEDRYPTPKLTGLKRSKSSSFASKKFKKSDKPNTNTNTNTKLDDFLNLSDL